MKNRIEYFDYLRVIASFAVVLIHVSARLTLDKTFVGVNYYILLGDMVRWCVPIFVMISGALFLDSKKDIKEIYKKNIFQILTALIFWSVVYAFLNNGNNKISPAIFGTMLDGPGHLWFLYMIIGLYMTTPILKKVVEDEKVCLYFIVLSLLFVFLIPRLVTVYSLVFGREASIISDKISSLELYLPLGYSGYYVLGYYLNKKIVSKNKELFLLGLFLCGLSFSLFSNIYNGGANIINQYFPLRYLTPTVLIESIFLFIFFKNHCAFCTGAFRKIIINMSQLSFGVYLVHIAAMNFLFDVVKVDAFFSNPVLSTICISIITFAISLLISKILNKIPFFSKYIC